MSQYHSHSLDGPHLLPRRLAQYLLLPRFRLLAGHRRLLRSVLYLRLLLPHVPLHRAGPTQPKGLFPWDTAENMALAVELVSEVEVVRCASGRLAEPAQRLDMVQRTGIYLFGHWQLLIREF